MYDGPKVLLLQELNEQVLKLKLQTYVTTCCIQKNNILRETFKSYDQEWKSKKNHCR